MKFVALLRGINVGGNNKVEMKKLKTTFERLGLTEVKTYINSGNIIFQDSSHTQKQLVSMLEKAIQTDFGLDIKVLLRDLPSLKKVVAALPKNWVNNDQMKCDVMFLWEEIDSPKVLEQLSIKPEIEDIRYLPGTVFWRIDKDKVTKSRITKMVGTKLYKQMTIRNCNTARKLLELMDQTAL